MPPRHAPKSNAFASISLGVVLAVAGGCASLAPESLRLSASVSRPFVIVSTEKGRGWGSASHPFLCWISDERLVATYWIAGDGAVQGISSVSWPAYTDDGGKTWSFGDPFEWAGGEVPVGLETAIEAGAPFGRKAPFSLGLFFGGARLADGAYIGHQHEFTAGNGFRGMGFLKAPEAPHVARPVQYHFPSAWTQRPSSIYISNQASVDSDGVVYTVAYGRMPGEKHSTFFFSSDDGGENFMCRALVAGPKDARWAGDGPSEPALVHLGDREFLCIMRTGTVGVHAERRAAAMLSARSVDGGLTWKLEKIRLPGVMPRLRLLADGSLTCSFGAPGNSLAFSFNGGRSWGKEVALTRADIKTTGYVDLMEVAPGKILVLSDVHDTPLTSIWLWEPERINGILGKFVTLRERF